MMPAAKHGDPQIGVDIHLCVVPPSPSPVPLPTPHMSIVFDPFDYLPILGATVTVCGMKRAIAGTSGKAVHIPPGFPFAPKIPDTSDEIFMGSATVVADGDPFSFLSVPVLGCQVAGMISPPRLKKKEKKLMLLPTVTNLAIPTNVFIGGPPTISLMGMAFKLGFAALGRFAKSKLFKRIRKKLFGKMKPGFLKCKILRAEPVDITTGEVSVEQQDFALPGRIPIDWVRTYTSNNTRRGACGHGWETPADIRLEVFPQDNSVAFLRPAAAPALFPEMPAAGGEEGAVLELWDGARLSDRGSELQVRTKEDGVYHFKKGEAFTRENGVREYPINRISDLCGNWLEFERHGPDVTSIKESAGRRIEIETEDGLIRQLQLFVPDAEFRHTFVQYRYDDTGNLVAVLDALGNPYTFAYDDHRLIRHTDRNRLSFYYEFARQNDTWRVVHSWGDGGLYNYRFEYLDELKERRITDSLGHVSLVKLDESNLPISEIDPLGGVTIYEYDDVGRTTAVVDQDGHRTEYEYDERGNLLKLTRPDGKAIHTEFDAASKAVAITDPNGGSWKQDWDPRGLVVRQITPLGHASEVSYDEWGQPVTLTNERGARTQLAFDVFGNLSSSADALGHRSELEYDEIGRVVVRHDSVAGDVSYAYDAKSRLVSVRDATGVLLQCAYDGEDRLVRMVDERGAATEFGYFGLDELSRRKEPDGSITEHHYDSEERLIGITDPAGRHYRITRDALGRITEETDYWGQSRRYAYSAAGHLRQRIDALGRQIEYSTDPVGRVVRKVLIASTTDDQPFDEAFEYDANGNIVTARNPHCHLTRAFDLEGRLIEESQNSEFTIRNVYDAVGNRLLRTTELMRGESAVTHRVRYDYDLLDRVVEIGIDDRHPVRISRDGLGRIQREQLSPSVTREIDYDADGFVARQRVHGGHGLVADLTYRYDAVGCLTDRIEDGSRASRFLYDPADRIVSYQSPAGRVESFAYGPGRDAFATTVIAPMRPTTDGRFLPGGEQSAVDFEWRREGANNGIVYRYDRVGDLIHCSGDNELNLSWNADQRLIASSRDGETTSYQYDPFGRRIGKRTGGRVTRFYWDGDVLAADMRMATAADAQLRSWIYHADSFEPYALVADGAGSSPNVFFYQNDPSGCPLRMIDGDGRVQWAAERDPRGRATNVSGTVDNPLRLQGQYEDAETGFHYNRFRYYDVGTGQFVSQDPLRFHAGENLYEFAPNTFAFVDPLGLRCGRVALDTNALIALMERDRLAVLRALGNRRPIVPITALREFAKGGGDVEALRRFLNKTEGAVVKDASRKLTRREMARGLARNDARIVATARKMKIPLLTRDDRVLDRAADVARTF